MKVVGVGCGPGMLTEQAIAAISRATVILGSKRAIALAATYIPEGCRVEEMTTFRPEMQIPGDAVVLSTGDPQLAGLGYLGGEIVPGISSLQVAAARLGIPLERISVVIAHGKEHDRALAEVAAEADRGKIVFIVADPKFSIAALASALAGSGNGSRLQSAKTWDIPARESGSEPLPILPSRSPGSSRSSWAGQACSQKRPRIQ